MSRYEIPFLTVCIQAFGERFAMSRQAAFRYLRDHKGLAFLTEFYALGELVKYVMEDTGCTIEQAMEKIYESPLMAALQDEDGELYVQSPAYLCELLSP